MNKEYLVYITENDRFTGETKQIYDCTPTYHCILNKYTLKIYIKI